MLTLVNSSKDLMGLSTDVKPINVPTNTLFLELDTKKFYYFDGCDWQPVLGGGGEPAVLIDKNITQNGDYSAADDDADGYSSVHVDVQPDLTTKSITQNGTYQASADNADGYSSVSVSVSAGQRDIEGDCKITDNTVTGFSISVEIPDGVTSIGQDAFLNIKNIVSVSFPSSITQIGYRAFEGCTGITNVDLSNTSITNGISASFFRNCTELVSILLPQTLTQFGNYMLGGCTKLASIVIPSGVTTLATNAFNGCTALMSITCLATTPPLASFSFSNVPADCAIYVPAGSVDAYKAKSGWSDRATYIKAIPAE